MKSFELEPKYSDNELPGKCVICGAEKELDNCLHVLLRGGDSSESAQEKFEMLIAFLKSPSSRKLRDESEKLLADGKQVKIIVNFINGKIKYKIETK
jgi:hypothetical protein